MTSRQRLLATTVRETVVLVNGVLPIRIWLILALISGASLLWAPRAESQESTTPCKNPRVTVEGNLSASWQEAVASLCGALDSMRDVDQSARLLVQPAEGGNLRVVASLRDGRVAERSVPSPTDLRATVEALVTLPPPLDAPKPAEAPEKSDSPAAPSRTSSNADVGRTHEHEPRPLAIEVGASAVGRVWGSPTYMSAGGNLYAGLRPGSWLFALLVRWDPLETLTGVAPSGFEMDTVGAGFVVARALGASPEFDIGATVSLLEETQSAEDVSGETSGSQTDVRAGVLARTLFGRGSFRGLVSFEADVSPGRLRRTARIAEVLPDLPSWSVGVGVGAAWEDR